MKNEQKIEKIQTNDNSAIKHVIGIMSGKGGVGKSSITSLTALALKNAGHKVGILDADITGPSIPTMFGLTDVMAQSDASGIYPQESVTGIKCMSVNLLLEDEKAPVVWRGPLLANTVKQFYTEVNWGELDYLLIDLPPGTGDVPLTVMQSLPIEGLIIVSSPQDLVKMIVTKSVKMAQMMEIPVLGIVENMSYLECPDCKKQINIFGKSNIEEVAKNLELDILAKLPIDPDFAVLCDEGRVEVYDKIKFGAQGEFAEALKKALAHLEQ